MREINQNNHVCNAWSSMKGYCVECGVHYTDEMERRTDRIAELEEQVARDYVLKTKQLNSISRLQNENMTLRERIRFLALLPTKEQGE